MTRVGVVVASVLACSCISPVIPIGGNGKSAAQLERSSMGKLYPAQLVGQGAYAGKVRVARVRVWADSDYRSQNLRWQAGFAEQLAYANEVLGPMLGVRLEPEYRQWERHSPGSQLEEDLTALAEADAGEDVVFVVGLTSSLSLAAATFDKIGIAEIGRKHVVLRGHADLEERKALERAYPKLDTEERDAVLEARRRHKTTAVLLHELAHSLGAPHEAAAEWVMSPTYSEHAAGIDEHTRALIAVTLEERLKPPDQRDPRAAAQHMVAALEAWDGWNAEERAELLANLRTFAAGGRAAVAANASALEAVQDAVAEIAKDSMSGGSAVSGRIKLQLAESKIAHVPAEQAGPAWLALAEAYSSLGSIASTEAALARAGKVDDDRGLAAWIAMTRARYGIPRDGAPYHVDADNDAQALAGVRNLLALVNAEKLADAAKAAAAAEARWPGLPGVLAERCDLELRRHATAAARPLCTRAAAGGSSWALYLSGILDFQSDTPTATRAGVAHLRAALALDPDLAQAWRALGKALARAHDTAALDQLQREYEARFRSQLAL